MSHITNIGAKIKKIRREKKLTLQQLSELTNLSVGFLSQLERGLSNVAIDTLQDIANALDVSIHSFIEADSFDQNANNPVMRDFEKTCSVINLTLQSYVMTNDADNLPFLPRIYHLLPSIDHTLKTELYHHEGVEWLYVIEGILSINYNNQQYDLYPGDTISIDSTKDHNWYNRSSKPCKFIAINTPNPYNNFKDE